MNKIVAIALVALIPAGCLAYLGIVQHGGTAATPAASEDVTGPWTPQIEGQTESFLTNLFSDVKTTMLTEARGDPSPGAAIFVKSIEPIKLIVVQSPKIIAFADLEKLTITISTGVYYNIYVSEFINEINDDLAKSTTGCAIVYTKYLLWYRSYLSGGGSGFPKPFAIREQNDCPEATTEAMKVEYDAQNPSGPQTDKGKAVANDIIMMVGFVMAHELAHQAFHKKVEIGRQQELEVDDFAMVFSLRHFPTLYTHFGKLFFVFIAAGGEVFYPEPGIHDHPSGIDRIVHMIDVFGRPETWTQDPTLQATVNKDIQSLVVSLQAQAKEFEGMSNQ